MSHAKIFTQSLAVKQSVNLLDQSLGASPKPQQTRFPAEFNTTVETISNKTTSILEQSIQSMTSTGVKYPLQKDSLVEDLDVSVSPSDDIELAACNGLYSQCKDALDQFLVADDALQFSNNMYRAVEEQVSILKKAVEGSSSGKHLVHSKAALKCLEQEMFTWQLITPLFRDRLITENILDENVFQDYSLNGVNEKRIVQALFDRDPAVRQTHIVLDWLEAVAKRRGYTAAGVEYFNQSVSLENTLHSLRSGRRDVSIVTELDPDATTRQGKPMAPLDKEDQNRFLKQLFHLVRSGQMKAAELLCRQCGQSWRAATLQGWQLLRDPNKETQMEGGGLLEPLEGNPGRDLWRSACWALASEEALPLEERAIYGSLSGNLASVLPVCSSWEDHLWAQYKVMVDISVELELSHYPNKSRTRAALPPAYWQQQSLTPSLAFQNLRSCVAFPDVVRETANKYREVQRLLVLDDTPGLLDRCVEWIDNDNEVGDLQPQFLRFVAHLTLFIRAVTVNVDNQSANKVIVTFIDEQLINRVCLRPLAACYTSKLPSELQTPLYSKLLANIDSGEDRQLYLGLAEDCGLNVALITKTLVESIRGEGLSGVGLANAIPSSSGQLESATTPDDYRKIHALDWLMFDNSQRAEALRQSNALFRSFLATSKLAAAKELLSRIPVGSVDVVYRYWLRYHGNEDLPREDSLAIREHLAVKAFIDAHDGFNDWFQHYSNVLPREPEAPVGGGFKDRVQYQQRIKEFEMSLTHWKHELQVLCQRASDRIYNVLMFADGGWMVDTGGAPPDSADPRAHQMELLRRLCIPPLALLLFRVLELSQRFTDSLELVDVIAYDSYKLYEVFSKEELKLLFSKVRSSCLQLMDQGLDPFGYTKPTRDRQLVP